MWLETLRYWKLEYFIAIGLVLTMAIPQVSAVHSQNLEWGFEEGQRYDFQESFQFNGDEDSISVLERYVMVAPALPVLEDPITNIPRANFEVFWPNNTPASGNELAGRGLAVPTGNWSLLTHIYEMHGFFLQNESEFENYSVAIIDTDQEWGFHYVMDDNEFSSNTIRITYSKQDGILLQMLLETEHTSSGDISTYTLIRLEGYPEIVNIILTGGALALVLIVLLIITRKRTPKA